MPRIKLLLAGLAGLFTVAAASPALAHGRYGYDGYGAYRPYQTWNQRGAWRARRFDAHRRWWQWRNYRPNQYSYDYYAPGYYGYYR